MKPQTSNLKSLKAGVIICASLVLMACKPAVTKPINTSFQPSVLNLKYNSTEPKVDSYAILRSIKDSIQSKVESIGAKKKAQYRSHGGGINNVYGYDINSGCHSGSQGKDCFVKIVFVKGEYYPSTRNTYSTRQEILIPVSFTTNNNLTKVKIGLSGQGKLIEGRNPVFITYDSYLSTHEIEKLFNKISSIKPSVTFTKEFSNQVEIDADDTIVFANLKRTYGLYRFASDQDKDKIGKKSAFNLSTKQGRVPLVVELYPTRKGSVLDYSFKQNFKAKPDGTVDFDQGSIDGLNRAIVNVASM